MKAMVHNKNGTTNVFNLKELEIPTLKQNEVLVKIHADSVKYWD